MIDPLVSLAHAIYSRPALAAGMFGGDYQRFLNLRYAFENWFNTVVV